MEQTKNQENLMSENESENPTEEQEELEQEELEQEEKNNSSVSATNQELEDHPIDILASAIEEIDNQITRMTKRNRNPTNLRSELINNVYPIINQGFSAIIDWMSAYDNSTEEEEEEDEEENNIIQKEMSTQIKSNLENAQILVDMSDEIQKLLLTEQKIKFNKVIDWLKNLITESNKLLEKVG